MRLQNFISASCQLRGVTDNDLPIEGISPSSVAHTLNSLELDFMILFLEEEIIIDTYTLFAEEMMYGFYFAKDNNNNGIYLIDNKMIMMKCCNSFEAFWDILFVAQIMSVLYSAKSSLSNSTNFKDALVSSLITDFLQNDESCFEFCRNVIG